MNLRAGGSSARRDLFLLLALGTILFTSGLGLKNPWPPDEPRFALIARDMVLTGNWLIPVRAGELYPDKPPLFMWIQAVIYATTRSIRLSHALPSILAALGSLALVWDLSRRLWNRRVAWWAGLTLLAVLQFPLQAKSGQIDATLCFWTTLGLYGLCRHLLLGPDWKACWIAFASMGFGIITKGVGFLPLLVLVPWLVAKVWKWPLPQVGGRRWGIGTAVAVGAIGLWLVPMLVHVEAANDPAAFAYRDNILFRQTAERYASSWAHVKPFGYYLTSVIPSLWLPVTLLLPWLVPAWGRRLARRDPRYLLLLGWIVLVILFFSLSPGKRGVYLLPAVPALALVAAPLMPGLWRRKDVQITGFVLLSALSALLAAVAVLGLWVRPEWVLKAEASQGALPWALAGAYGAAGALPAITLRPGRGLGGLVLFFWAGWLFLGGWAYPALDSVRSGSALMERVSARLSPREELAILDWREQMILQADRQVTHFGYHAGTGEETRRHAASWLLERPGRRLLLPSHALELCFDPEGAVDVGTAHRRHWLLVGAEAVRDPCREGLESPPDIYRSLALPSPEPIPELR